jgi:hypothetical protein
MYGPDVIARSISAIAIPDRFNNTWQYHSQSDRHSKITCWAIMFDLICNCSKLRQHIADAKVGFGINLKLHDFQTRREKVLDLVIATPSTSERIVPKKRGKIVKRPIVNFVDIADEHEVKLTVKERAHLASLPELKAVAVGSVCVALEAKATMTAHIKALPRLHDELDSSHLTVHGHADHSVAAALVTVNMAQSFISPKMNQFDRATRAPVINAHDQPKSAQRTIDKVTEIRRRNRPSEQGFDAVGILVVDLANDGSPCKIVTRPPAPQPGDPLHYDAMIARICSQYHAKFDGL